jgi:transposase
MSQITFGFPGSVKEIRYLAEGLLKDEEAVRQAITQPWSNGQTQGQLNLLKNIRRLMYGRAKSDLIRIRILARSKPTLHFL